MSEGVTVVLLMGYNQPVNFHTFSSPLRYCLAAMLLLSLWVSGAQDLWIQDVLENGEIELTLDADTHANDSQEQVALISVPLLAVYIAHHANAPLQPVRIVLSDLLSPPDRPPARFV